MKKVLFVLSALTALYATPGQAQTGFGQAGKINDGWKFTLKDSVGYQVPSVSDAKWKTVNLPHDWSVKGQLSPTLASATGYLPGGIGWYRKQLNVPADKKGEKVYLYFEGVYNRSEVFINGHSLGKRPNGYVSFAYDATQYINYGGNNTIAVRVDHSQSADSRWYTGSGIYRDVYVVYANPVHIAQWGTYAYPEVKGSTGNLNTEVEVENTLSQNATLSVLQELVDANGKVVAKNTQSLKVSANSKATAKAKLSVKNALLWDTNNPHLYTLKVTVSQNGKTIDQSSFKTGFRTFTFDANKGFALNGKWTKMKGVCLHHDAGVLGSVVPREVWKDRLLTLKSIGVNAVRTSHNPQAPVFYELCDELGLLVLNEAYDEWEYPKRKWIEGWNVGTPGFQGSFDIFADWSEKDLEDMVRRDRNHTSVFAWSIGNEVDYPNDPYSHPVLDGSKDGFSQAQYGGYKKDAPNAERLGAIAERLAATVKRFDKSRPVTAGLAGVAMSNETGYPGALDIAGYNYTESKYGTDHAKYPKRVIYGSENRHDIEAWLAVKNNEHIFGQFLWTGIDYLGESGRWPSRGFYSGLVDFSGNIKPRGYFRKALWDDKPTIYAGTYINYGRRNELSMDAWPVWNYEKGQTVRVVAYMNTPSAKLYLNGKQVGEEKQYDNKTGIVYWDVPYEAGKLEVAGFDKGKETARYTITSSARPYKLVAKASASAINKDKGVVEIRLEVQDENGVPVMISDNEVTCKVSGPATLLGLEAGNNEDMTDYTDNVHRAHHGKILAYVQANGEAGEATISFTSPWLEPTQVKIQLQ
ncbi:glycoside hydrolase [Flavobacterium akiainvivens]|uniref:Glycoside hydrolase n=1 Tax=Flavobacterium akiainvivens TaxID=1202724 RepID=A0A0M8MF04_9FLAO|nr:sugar-binding domain-containing protein [Flavobacterium akiainvivens]KOS07524.1 glycoside hydrolase [Flavobacterium akiainvivens]SFQ64001.1 protein of unknown function [Flavobacterium akiainvivens]